MALIHGGDTEGFFLEKGYAPLDFSANTNPLGVPRGVLSAVREAAKTACDYPDPLNRRLCAAIAAHEGVFEAQVLCGNGAADLLFRLALSEKPKTALVTAPAFAEYEAALQTVGCAVSRHTLLREEGFAVTDRLLEKLDEGYETLFLCNPNNPTGVMIEQNLLLRVLQKCEQTGTLLVVDECFNGFLNEPAAHTMKPYLKSKNLLLLKAFTKLYGMAGIRLGYSLSGNAALLSRMASAGQPWAVSSLAQAAGLAALGEGAYLEKSLALIKKEKEYLLQGFRALGLEVYGSEANYIFFRSSVPDLARRLRDKGILVRDCANYFGLCEGDCRVAVRTRIENRRLLKALRETLRGS